ncbi:MAG: ABC transporter substrate-binding protein, partial [Chloroflexi bacterium]|nr:ABC transporter substrate-binding protein [Chloroflexota bacterium]
MMSSFLPRIDRHQPARGGATSVLTTALLAALLAPAALVSLVGCKGSSDSTSGGSTTVTTTTGAPGGRTSATGAASKGGTILIGEYGSLSGDTATFGTSTDNGIKLAISKANSQGGALNKQLSVQVRDDRSDADATASTVESLISQNVVAVLGEVASTRSLRGAPVCQAKKIPMISPASTNPTVTQVGDYIFRVCFIDEFQGRAIAQIGTDILHAKRAVILYDNGQDYSTGLSAFIKKDFTAKGGQVVGELSYSKDTTNFSGQLTTIKQLNPDVIFIPGYYNQVGQIARQARTIGITAPLVGGDGWDSPDLTKIAAGGLNNCYFSDHFSPDEKNPVVQDFVKAYAAANGGRPPDAMAALGYDAAGILIDAIKRAG